MAETTKADHRLRLKKKIFIDGEIEALTGLHIGGSSIGLSIGGPDKVVVRNPLTNMPYIPGSSLKGKMRSLLEKCHGLVDIVPVEKEGKEEWEGRLCDDPDHDLVQLFGYPAEKGGKSQSHAPTRLTVRDGDLINHEELASLEDTDMYLTEIKTEVSIDRLTSMANPRSFERVPAGARFRLGLIVDIYNVDEENNREKTFVKMIRQGLELIQDDYLGGQGTRGYGRVRFNITSVKERTAQDYIERTSGYRDSAHQKEFQSFMNVG